MFFDEIIRKMDKVLADNAAGNKEIIIWGYRREVGEFVTDYFDKRRSVYQYTIVDRDSEGGNFKIETVEYLKSKEIGNLIVFLCMGDTKTPENILMQMGAQKNRNYFDVREIIFGCNKGQSLDFLAWMEEKYNCDFLANKRNECFECVEYTPSPYGTIKKIVSVLELNDEDALFDFGMGKGGTLVQFYEYGLRRLGGVERDTELYEIAQDNFNKLGIKNIEAVCADAREITEIDHYNYFYFYNPFSGSIFQKVMDHIADSYKREKRKIRIIYINTVCHDTIINSGIFKIEKQIETTHWYPMVNIYTTE